MERSYRIKVFVTLFITAIVILFTVSALDYQRLKEQALDDNNEQVNQATDTVMYALNSMDKSYHYMDQEMNMKMEEHTQTLQNKYEKNSDFSTWDFQELANKFGMDIYILNKDNQIIHSNVDDEVGIDFAECCKSLSEILHERREKNELFIDEIDIDQQTGKAKKYSYMGTEDQEYLIELGYFLDEEPLYQEFNFFTVTDDIVDNFTMIEDVTILNFGGIAFGQDPDDHEPEVRKEAFQEARDTNETVEVEHTEHGEKLTYRYIPYESDYDQDGTQTRVVEILYDNYLLDKALEGIFKTFLIQLFIVFITTGLALFALSHILSKPIHLAYHDSLTGLRNRAAFDNYMESMTKKGEKDIALLLIDVDNFKVVNDQLGHSKGDALLKTIAIAIDETMSIDSQHVYRFGGDEFAVIIEDVQLDELSYIASTIIQQVKEAIKEDESFVQIGTSISVGVASTAGYSSLSNLFQHADMALYQGKSKGKNQYQIYKYAENDA